MSDLQELLVGSTRVVALKDGELTLPKEILLNIDEETTKKLSEENNQLTNSQINAYLIFKNEKILLVDSGCRDLFGPTCGFVYEEIAKASVKPEDVTDIFFTHLHPDHVGGSINKDGKAIFPNATVNIIEDELNFWSKDDFEDVEVNGKNMADLNKSVIKAYGERVKTIKTNQEIISFSYPFGKRASDENESKLINRYPELISSLVGIRNRNENNINAYKWERDLQEDVAPVSRFRFLIMPHLRKIL